MTGSTDRGRNKGDAAREAHGKTIAEHMRDVLLEMEPVPGYLPAVMWGDVHLLDDCASRATHTNLMRTWPPYKRHKRIFAALEGRPNLFEKKYVRMNGGRWEGNPWWRIFELREETGENQPSGETEDGAPDEDPPREHRTSEKPRPNPGRGTVADPSIVLLQHHVIIR